MITTTQQVAALLCSIGWRSPNDLNWTKLESVLPELEQILLQK